MITLPVAVSIALIGAVGMALAYRAGRRHQRHAIAVLAALVAQQQTQIAEMGEELCACYRDGEGLLEHFTTWRRPC